MLSLVLAESSIELVPNEIAGHPAIIKWAKRKRKDPRHLVLDQNYHHAAILRLGKSGLGRGRPDIVHFCLLVALGSPLNTDSQLSCYVHTRDDHVISIDPRTRLPRNTDRFTALVEQLYQDSMVPSSGPALLKLKKESLKSLLGTILPDRVVALTTLGSPNLMEAVAEGLRQSKRPVLLVGGFPTGHFSDGTMKLASEKIRVDGRSLEAWTVVARAVYDYEKAIGTKRF
ncbi:MAG TPA: 16S rRNA methyltransferase [Candidatus Angelobacter sp.]|nr:16S rRNA methyltransferase [Candidatus Angelobacter sp.]